MLLTEPVDDVLDCGAASLVSLGEDDVPDWSAGLVLSEQNIVCQDLRIRFCCFYSIVLVEVEWLLNNIEIWITSDLFSVHERIEKKDEATGSNA